MSWCMYDKGTKRLASLEGFHEGTIREFGVGSRCEGNLLSNYALATFDLSIQTHERGKIQRDTLKAQDSSAAQDSVNLP